MLLNAGVSSQALPFRQFCQQVSFPWSTWVSQTAHYLAYFSLGSFTQCSLLVSLLSLFLECHRAQHFVLTLVSQFWIAGICWYLSNVELQSLLVWPKTHMCSYLLIYIYISVTEFCVIFSSWKPVILPIFPIPFSGSSYIVAYTINLDAILYSFIFFFCF